MIVPRHYEDLHVLHENTINASIYTQEELTVVDM